MHLMYESFTEYTTKYFIKKLYEYIISYYLKYMNIKEYYLNWSEARNLRAVLSFVRRAYFDRAPH